MDQLPSALVSNCVYRRPSQAGCLHQCFLKPQDWFCWHPGGHQTQPRPLLGCQPRCAGTSLGKFETRRPASALWSRQYHLMDCCCVITAIKKISRSRRPGRNGAFDRFPKHDLPCCKQPKWRRVCLCRCQTAFYSDGI